MMSSPTRRIAEVVDKMPIVKSRESRVRLLVSTAWPLLWTIEVSAEVARRGRYEFVGVPVNRVKRMQCSLWNIDDEERVVALSRYLCRNTGKITRSGAHLCEHGRKRKAAEQQKTEQQQIHPDQDYHKGTFR